MIAKCKFCCNIAHDFNWGNTFFCNQCLRRQIDGDYVSKIPKDKLPKCNPKTCSFGGQHKPNGENDILWFRLRSCGGL